MFFSRHLYIVILCYVLLILGVAGTGLVLIVTHTGIIIGCLIIIISFFITGALVKRLNKSNAKLKLFFDAIEDKENMIQFNEYSGDREMNALSRSLNRINELLATAKSDSQNRKNFYYSLLEEIPSGINCMELRRKNHTGKQHGTFTFRIRTTGFCPTTKTTLSRNKRFPSTKYGTKIDCHTFHWQTAAFTLSKLYETGTGNNNPACHQRHQQ